MRKCLLLPLLWCMAALSGNCTVWTVGNVANTFSPSTITITFGDTVNFSITGAHDAREVSQATYNANGNTPLPGFQTPFGGGLVLPAQLAVGTHYYVCTPHAGLGMKGIINVNPCTTPATPGTITGNATICAGTSNTYSIAAVPGATSYTWTLPGGWTGTSTTTSITTTASSTSGTISVTANNGCGSSSPRTLSVTVNTIPATPGTISGNASVCVGSANTYSITTVPGATSYTWTLPGGWSGTSTTNSMSATAGSNSGNVTVTANNSCGASSAQTLAVTVSATPATPGSISGTATPCSGSSNTYSVTAVPGATSYTWTLPSGWTGTSTTNSIATTANTTSGNITVTASNTCGTSAPQTLTVTVTNTPGTPGSISGNATVCVNSTNTYSVTAVPGATTYTWTLPGGWTGSSTSNSITCTAGATGGTISVIANNSCGSSAAQTLTATVTTAPSAPGSISGSTNVCAASTNSYSVVSVPGATSYTWTLPGGWTGTSTTNSITAVPNGTSGNVTVTANNSCGASAPQTLSVTVTSAPATPGTISGSASVCVGSSNSYSITAVPGATAYTWTLPGGWTGSSTTTSIATTAGATGGNITVTANNSCGTSGAQTLAVTVSATPSTPGTISGNTTVCAGTTNTYSVGAVAGATAYTWTLPGGWTGTSTTNSISTTAGAVGGNISVSASNACGTSGLQTLAITVNTAPATPGTITGNATVCAGSANTYSVAAVSGATSYTWTLPGGWTGTSTTSSIAANASTTSGNITVTANNSCGASAAQTLPVTVNTAVPATPGTITGSTTVCAASANTYSIAAVSGATSYTWTLPGGWTGTSTTTSISTVAGATGGSITVTANNACGSSTVRSLSVTVTGNTALPQPGTISGNATVCAGSTNTYSIAPVSGATSYTWTLPGGWTGTSTTTSITAVASANSGNITVSANNICGSSAVQTLAVTVNSTPATPGTISGTAAVCTGSSNNYSIATVPGATTYTWTLPNGWSGTSTTNAMAATAGSAGGNITVTAGNVCGTSGAQTLAVSIIPLPNMPGSISSNTTVCAGGANSFSIAAVSGATDYTWTLPSGWTGTSTTTAITATASTTSGDVTVTANNACGASAAQTLTVTAIAAPALPDSIGGATEICVGSSATFFVPAVSGASAYTWVLPNGWTGSSASDSITVTAGATGGTISVTANNACGTSPAQTLTVSILTPPASPGSINGPATVCAGSTNTYSVAVVPGATSYTWTLPNGWTGASTLDSIVVTAGNAGGSFLVTADDACGTSAPQTFAVSVNSVDTSVTSSGNILIANAAGATYQWIDCNTQTPLNGQVGQSFTATVSGSYGVIVTQNGCSDTSSCYSLTLVGVLAANALQVDIFPNPSNGQFQLVLGDDVRLNEAKVEIFSLQGVKVLEVGLSQTVTSIDLGPHAQGIYIVRVQEGAAVTTKKILVK